METNTTKQTSNLVKMLGNFAKENIGKGIVTALAVGSLASCSPEQTVKTGTFQGYKHIGQGQHELYFHEDTAINRSLDADPYKVVMNTQPSDTLMIGTDYKVFATGNKLDSIKYASNKQ